MDILTQIIADIRRVKLSWELPEEIDNPMKQIHFSNTGTIYINNSLLITSHVPLVRKNKYKLYQLHPILILQQHHEKPTMAYVQAQYQYLARSFDHKHYLQITQEDFTTCNWPEKEILSTTFSSKKTENRIMRDKKPTEDENKFLQLPNKTLP